MIFVFSKIEPPSSYVRLLPPATISSSFIRAISRLLQHLLG